MRLIKPAVRLIAYLAVGTLLQLGGFLHEPVTPHETDSPVSLFVTGMMLWPVGITLEAGYWMAKQADERRTIEKERKDG